MRVPDFPPPVDIEFASPFFWLSASELEELRGLALTARAQGSEDVSAFPDLRDRVEQLLEVGRRRRDSQFAPPP